MRNFFYIFKHEEIVVFVGWNQEDLRFKVCVDYIVRPCPKTQNQSNSKSRDSMGKWVAWDGRTCSYDKHCCNEFLLENYSWKSVTYYYGVAQKYSFLSVLQILSLTISDLAYEFCQLLGTTRKQVPTTEPHRAGRLEGGCELSKWWRMDLGLWSYC